MSTYELTLTDGTATTIDNDPVLITHLEQYRWRRLAGREYVIATIDGCLRYLHRVVSEFFDGPIPDNLEVHHDDDDPNNNRRGNLIRLTHAEHIRQHNLSRRTDNPSGYRGITRSGSGWKAQLRVRDTTRYIGSYATAEAAARAYDEAALATWPDLPVSLNFPKEPANVR